ncbi:hypothetical protein RRG08_032618 [Elysia crispata]|uniref:Uncharacterized protein n=1 Tax=Elysia crispata TaxID=231223 RepID=A0AAE0XZM8_9GAST|nr:hypothetical protein RRG08_032618 [Elysia crispata]
MGRGGFFDNEAGEEHHKPNQEEVTNPPADPAKINFFGRWSPGLPGGRDGVGGRGRWCLVLARPLVPSTGLVGVVDSCHGGALSSPGWSMRYIKTYPRVNYLFTATPISPPTLPAWPVPLWVSGSGLKTSAHSPFHNNKNS